MRDVFKLIGGVLAIALVIFIAAMAYNVATRPLRTASGLMDRTLNSRNVEATYELFHDRYRGFQSRLAQIESSKGQLASETDNVERNRIRIELNAQRQSCRDIVSAYNADATKTNRSIFQGTTLPSTLSLEAC
jgi:hypothetical protein